MPPLVAAAVAIAVGLLMTGAFHEDGLGDIADAFGGGTTVERRLQILKDPRHGTYGVCAICASIVVRVACVASMPGPRRCSSRLLVAGALGRAAAVVLTAAMPPASYDGLGATAAGELGRARRGSRWSSPCHRRRGRRLVDPGRSSALPAAARWSGRARDSKIGGINGDVLGATEVVTECLCLVVASGLATHASLWWS